MVVFRDRSGPLSAKEVLEDTFKKWLVGLRLLSLSIQLMQLLFRYFRKVIIYQAAAFANGRAVMNIVSELFKVGHKGVGFVKQLYLISKIFIPISDTKNGLL